MKSKVLSNPQSILEVSDAAKSIDPARLRYPSGKSVQGSNPKVAVRYSKKLTLKNFQKLKAESMPVNMLMFLPPA